MHNTQFWLALDRLLIACQVIINHPKGSPHPQDPNHVYPVDYGYLRETRSSGGASLDIFVGKGPSNPVGVVGIINLVNLVHREADMKLLVRCNSAETQAVLAFLNAHWQYALYIPRPTALPYTQHNTQHTPPPQDDPERTEPRPLR
ncbi:MAG: hypothetical protein ACLFTK_10755 [Anaerolineales bacterium]